MLDEDNAWTPGPNLPEESDYQGCTMALNDKETRHMFVSGNPVTSQAYVYDWEDPGSGWFPAGELQQARKFLQCTKVVFYNTYAITDKFLFL